MSRRVPGVRGAPIYEPDNRKPTAEMDNLRLSEIALKAWLDMRERVDRREAERGKPDGRRRRREP